MGGSFLCSACFLTIWTAGIDSLRDKNVVGERGRGVLRGETEGVS